MLPDNFFLFHNNLNYIARVAPNGAHICKAFFILTYAMCQSTITK